jgi:hypothetical protein
MLRRLRPQLIGVWLLCGVLLPGAFSIVFPRQLAQYHGILVTSNRGSWYALTLESAIAQLSPKEKASMTVYLWSSRDEDRFLAIRGTRNCIFQINKKVVLQKKNALINAGSLPLTAGLSELDLFVDEDNERIPEQLQIQWSTNYVTAESISGDQLYNRMIPESKIKIERMAHDFGIFARLNLVLLVIWILFRLWNPQIPLTKGDIAANRFLILGLFVIFALRFAGIRYQMEELLHPDERMYGRMIAEMHAGKLAPSQFLYTTGYFVIIAEIEHLAEWIAGREISQYLIQRLVSATASCLTCLIVFATARRLFSRREAILATFLFGFSYVPIEVAHFGIVEPTLLFFFLLALHRLVILWQEPSMKAFVLSGFFSGIAVAIKQTAAIIVVPFLITWIVLLRKDLVGKSMKRLLIWGAAAFVGFCILSPGTLLELPKFYQYQLIESKSMEGRTNTHLFFSNKNAAFGTLALKSLQTGVGLPLMIAAIPGLFLVWKKLRAAAWLLILPAAIYFVLISKAAVVADHYVLMLCPFVACFASLTLTFLIRGSPSFKKWLSAGVVIILLLPSLRSTSILERILQHEDTRRQAEEWCYKNLADSKIYYEIFGPRFLIPAVDSFLLPLFRRPDWTVFTNDTKPVYIAEDDITSDLFSSSPDFFASQVNWYIELKKHSQLIKEFHGEKFRLFNPLIQIYKISQPERKASS